MVIPNVLQRSITEPKEAGNRGYTPNHPTTPSSVADRRKKVGGGLQEAFRRHEPNDFRRDRLDDRRNKEVRGRHHHRGRSQRVPSNELGKSRQRWQLADAWGATG